MVMIETAEALSVALGIYSQPLTRMTKEDSVRSKMKALSTSSDDSESN